MAKPSVTVAAIVATLFGKSQTAISEKLSTEEYNTFATEAQEVNDRLDTQQQGNIALKADVDAATTRADQAEAALATANASLTTVQGELATAQARVTELEPAASQWDAYQASLKGTHGNDGTTPPKPKPGASTAEQAHIDELRTLKAKHPSMFEGIDVPDGDE